MSYVETQAPSTVGQFESAPAVERRVGSTVFQCLVVSASQSRREMLLQAATEGGWDTVVCADAQNALAEQRRSVFQLAIVDLEANGSGTPAGFRELCEQLSTAGGDRLLAVCGHEGDGMEEIWARQLGAWLYLPGVEPGDDVTHLCGEALKITKHLMEVKEGKSITARV